MVPMPPAMLGDSCVLEKYRRSISGRQLISRSVLMNVRICRSRRWVSDGDTDRLSVSGILYFDMFYSRPEDTEFMGEGYISEVVFEGDRYAVRSAEIFCGDEGIHHFEVHMEMM